MPNLLSIPSEVRSQIYDECFPPSGSRVQLIPYSPSTPECNLNLPLSLYLSCKTIYTELANLTEKLHSLNLLYIIEGTSVNWSSFQPTYIPIPKPISPNDPEILRFQKLLEFAQRIRLVSGVVTSTVPDSLFKRVRPGKKCALRVLEVVEMGPTTGWDYKVDDDRIMSSWEWDIHLALTESIRPLVQHPDVVARGLEIKSIEAVGDQLGSFDINLMREWMD